jgi:hypothetical protein
VNGIKQLSHAEQIAWKKKCILEDWLVEEPKEPAANDLPEQRN